jgi:putative pyruvate formate lyase activating enzyme
VFFSGCTLRCAYCQNWQVSRGEAGGVLSPDGLADVFLRLQEAGAENVNAVTGTHFAPGIVEAFERAGARGLSIPLVWNSSGYESIEAVDFLAPHVRFFLPDLKTLDAGLALRWLNAADYPERAAEALLAMAEAVPLVLEGGDPVQGVIVRHLVLPGNLEDTRNVLAWFKANLDGRALLSLMFQYTPIPGLKLMAPLDRALEDREYRRACAMLEELGIEDGYFQEPATGGDWLPDFTSDKPFPSGSSRVVWHYLFGA